MKRSFLTILALLLASMMLFAACGPTGTTGGGTTQGATDPVGTPGQTGDQIPGGDQTPGGDTSNPAEKKQTYEYSALSMDLVLVTWNENGVREKEFSYLNEMSIVYIYNTQKVLSAIQISTFGEIDEFTCEYDENGVPTKAISDQSDEGCILFEFDANKKMTKMVFADENEQPMMVNYYDAGGKLSKTELWSTIGGTAAVMATMQCEYNGDNISAVNVLMGEMSMGQETFTYDENGLIKKIETKSPDETGALQLDGYAEYTHSETSHVVKNYTATEDGFVAYNSTTYDANWKQTERVYYDEAGAIQSKETYGVDANGNRVVEYFEQDGEELKLIGKSVYAVHADGSQNWQEEYVADENGELYLSSKTIYTATGYAETYYDESGKEESKYVEETDADGNYLLQQYRLKQDGEGLYLYLTEKRSPEYVLIEDHCFDEAGIEISKTIRRDKQDGGYFLDYYFLGESGQLELDYSEEYDEFGMPIPGEGNGGGSDEGNGGGGSSEEPGEEPSDPNINNGGANTEEGWGPIIR